MAEPASSPRRALRAFVVPVLLAMFLLAGCGASERAELRGEIERLKTELETAQRSLAESEKLRATQHDELLLQATSLETAKAATAETQVTLAQRDVQLRALQTEAEALKKKDAFVFAEIAAQQQQGRGVIALSRYKQFLRDYPASSLAPSATAAIAELSANAQADQQRWANATDPKRQERELLGLFRDGLLTPRELAPIIRKKSRAQVLAMLGKPSHVFPDGAEIGYAEKITNPATGRKAMLVITFDAAGVAALRVDYAGQKMIP